MFHNNTIALSYKASLLLLAVMVLCWLAPGAQAQMSAISKATLTEGSSSVAIGPDLYVTQDAERALSYKAIVTRHQNNIRGTRHDGNIINMGLGPVPAWMVLTVDNKTNATDWVLHFGQVFDGRYATIKKLLVINQSTNQTFTRALREDDIRGAHGEDLNGPSLFIKLRPKQTDTLVFYVEAGGGTPATIAPHLLTSKKFIQTLRYGDLPSVLGGIFFVSMMGFFIAILYMERRPTYMFFLIYYFLLATLFFGMGNTFFTEWSFTGELLGMLYIASIAVGLVLTKTFFDIGVEDHKENSLLSGGFVLLGLGAAISVSFFDDEMLLNQLVLLVPPYVTILVIAFVSALQIKHNKYGAIYFSMGWMCVFIGSLMTGIAASSHEPSPLFMNAIWLALLPQAGLFVLATTKKIQMMDEEFRQEKIRESRMARSLARLKQSKESADQARLLRVIERERELMSELREREMLRTEEMRRAKEGADQANRAKSAFLAVVTHEIRTPMTGIMGMVRLLLDTKLSTKQNEYALAIQKSGDTMIALLNDILDFEKSKGGKMELEHVDFDVLRLVQDVVLLMSGRTSEKNIYLKADIDPSVPRYVRGDPARLRQVLLNLVTNAIKFTGDGGVTIRLRAKPLDKSQGPIKGDYEIYFGIEDTGIGIPEDMQQNLFVPFMQADSSVSRKYGGTGLGLAICKKLIEAMGGSISVSSQLNVGSTFFFTILMEEGDADLAALTDAPKNYNNLQSSVPPQNILVVEDNEMNRRVLQGLLEKYGHHTDLAKSGEDALEKASRKQYDVILMDIELPGMSGDETTRALRHYPDRAIAATPVIALTGHVMMEDIERFYEANMNGHIAKPIQPEQLLETLKRVHAGELENPIILQDVIMPAKPAETSKPAPVAVPTDDGMTPMQRYIHAQQNAAHPQDELDVDSFEEATRSFEMEKNSFIVPSQPAMAAEAAAVEIDESLLDKEMLESLRTTLGAQQMEELLGGFFKTCDDILGAINNMIASGDTAHLQARAHELKGMAANFGIKTLADIAGNVEKFCRDGQPEAGLAEAEKLPAIATQTRATVRAWMG